MAVFELICLSRNKQKQTKMTYISLGDSYVTPGAEINDMTD